MRKGKRSLRSGGRATPPSPATDSRHFTNTAKRTKAVNLGNVVFRGGIRF